MVKMLNFKTIFFPLFPSTKLTTNIFDKKMFLKRQNILEGNGDEIKCAIKGFFYICFENGNVKKILRIKKK
jgi:hypothetical protein